MQFKIQEKLKSAPNELELLKEQEEDEKYYG